MKLLNPKTEPCYKDWLPAAPPRHYLHQRDDGSWIVIDRTLDISVSKPYRTKEACIRAFQRSVYRGAKSCAKKFGVKPGEVPFRARRLLFSEYADQLPEFVRWANTTRTFTAEYSIKLGKSYLRDMFEEEHLAHIPGAVRQILDRAKS